MPLIVSPSSLFPCDLMHGPKDIVCHPGSLEFHTVEVTRALLWNVCILFLLLLFLTFFVIMTRDTALFKVVAVCWSILTIGISHIFQQGSATSEVLALLWGGLILVGFFNLLLRVKIPFRFLPQLFTFAVYRILGQIQSLYSYPLHLLGEQIQAPMCLGRKEIGDCQTSMVRARNLLNISLAAREEGYTKPKHTILP